MRRAGLALAGSLFIAALAAFLIGLFNLAHANAGMMNVGVLMPGSSRGSGSDSGFGILTESNQLITTENNIVIQTE